MDRTDPNPGGSAGPGPEGRTTQVKAEIYKLMLHEEGAFLPHQDSEKADEIFVTTFVMNLYRYDIEKLSLALSYVIVPEYLTFAEGIKIDDDAIFVQDDPFCDGQKGKRTQTQDHNFFIFLMMPHSHFSKVEKTQDFVLHGDRLRQMSGYFASFPEWPKRFELVTY
ncbi:hypothetical protein V8E54_002044 [Elaphomyces granulatus]